MNPRLFHREGRARGFVGAVPNLQIDRANLYVPLHLAVEDCQLPRAYFERDLSRATGRNLDALKSFEENHWLHHPAYLVMHIELDHVVAVAGSSVGDGYGNIGGACRRDGGAVEGGFRNLKGGVAEAEAEWEERLITIQDISASSGGMFVIEDGQLADVKGDGDGNFTFYSANDWVFLSKGRASFL